MNLQHLKGRWRTRGYVLLLAAMAAIWLALEWRRIMFVPLPIAVPTEVIIAPGRPLATIAAELEERGVLYQARDLVILARLRDVAGSIKAGEYLVEPGTTTAGLLDQMVSGHVVLHALTLVEGSTYRDLFEALERHPAIVRTLPLGDPAAVMTELGMPGEHPEGRFLPDTYRFPRGTTDRDFLLRAMRTMDATLADAWARRDPDLPLATPYEALILASIVEKETAVESERRTIAGVFVRRLQRGMRLQTDPTVIYGLGERFDGNLRKRDLLTDTPYNTYTRSGLPPTPICLPGRASIEAVMHPEPGDALYFVADGKGGHYFSATLAEHNAAVQRFLAQLRAQRKERQ